MSEKTTITLNDIVCIETSEPGHDEVYIKYQIDGGLQKRYPSSSYHSMSPEEPPWGSPQDPLLVLTFKESALVALYDNDKGNDDFLGSHTYTPADPQPESVEVSNTNGAKYQLNTVAG